MATAAIYTNDEPVSVYTRYGEPASQQLKAAGARWDPRERAWMAPVELVRRLAAAGIVEITHDWTAMGTSELIAYCEQTDEREPYWALARRIGDDLRELPYQLEFSVTGKSCWVGIETRAFAATLFARFDGQRLRFEVSLVDDVPPEVAEKFDVVAGQFNAARKS